MAEKRVLAVDWDPERLEQFVDSLGRNFPQVVVDSIHHKTIEAKPLHDVSLTQLLVRALENSPYYNFFVLSTDYGFESCMAGIHRIRMDHRYQFTPVMIRPTSSARELGFLWNVGENIYLLSGDARELFTLLQEELSHV